MYLESLFIWLTVIVTAILCVCAFISEEISINNIYKVFFRVESASVFSVEQCSIKGEEEQTGPSEEMLEIEIPFQSKPCWVSSAPIKRMSKSASYLWPFWSSQAVFVHNETNNHFTDISKNKWKKSLNHLNIWR